MKTGTVSINSWISTLRDQKQFYVMMMGCSGNICFMNTHFIKTLQLTDQRLQQKTIFDFIHTDDLPIFKDALRHCQESGNKFTIEIRIKNGHYRWVKWEISIAGGVNKNFLCLGYDIPCDEQIKKYNSINNENYQRIVEGLNMGVLFQDFKGSVISANQQMAEILGGSLESLYTGNNIYAQYRIKDEQNVAIPFEETPFMRALKTGETQTNIVLKAELANGTNRILLCNSQPLFENNQRQPFSVVSTIIDITKEKMLEEEARVRGALFNSFMNHAPYFTWITDSEENLIFANQLLLDYFGADATAYGKNIFQLVPLSVASVFHDKHCFVLNKNIPHKSILKSKMADGKDAVFQITVFPIHISPTEIMIGGEALDVTDAWQAQQEVKRTNQHLLYLTEATSEAMWDWNLKTGHLFCNMTMHELMGEELGAMFNTEWLYSRIHEEDKALAKQVIQDTLSQGKHTWETEYRYKDSKGIFRRVINRGHVIYEDNGPVRMIGSLQDISVLRKLQSELMDQKLQQQKNIAEAVIHAQEEERARIGHELHDNVNQILSTAQLFINLLDPASDNYAEVKEKARASVLLGIEEIRKLSKDMVMPGMRAGGLLESIQSIVDDLCYIKPFNISFTHNTQCDIESLTRNKKITLFRIIQEQIKNIIKYSKAKNVEILLQCTALHIQLIIIDDGLGFDSKSTKRGLGLSHIYERTHLENGKVLLDTAPGKGCRLTISIPFDSKTA